MPLPPTTISARPTLLVDGQYGRRVVDNMPPLTQGSVGTPGPWARGRMVYALPINGNGPVQLTPPIVLYDTTSYVVDPQGNFVGEANAIFCSRLLQAAKSEETRRF
jgi:hypothetical protein